MGLARLRSAPYPVPTVGIPSFDNRGLLPAGPNIGSWEGLDVFEAHDCDMAEIEARFVTSSTESTTRAALFNEIHRFARMAKERIDCFQLHVSGEFVTKRVDPEHALLILEASGEYAESLDPDQMWSLHRLFGGEFKFGQSFDFRIETRLVLAYSPGHINFEGTNYDRILALLEAGTPIPNTEAGFVAFLECERGLDFVFAISEPD